MSKVTVKIPKDLYDVLKREAEQAGVGIQKLAGMILLYGFKEIQDKQRELDVHTKD